MSSSIDDLVRDLQGFTARREVIKALKKQIRTPLPAVRKSIKRRALSTLPHAGGLNKWAARTRVTAQVKVSSRSASIKLIGRRKSQSGMADLKRLDRGRIRHPSWGRRKRGQWHTQSVMPGYFTAPASEVEQWRAAVLDAVDDAIKTIKG